MMKLTIGDPAPMSNALVRLIATDKARAERLRDALATSMRDDPDEWADLFIGLAETDDEMEAIEEWMRVDGFLTWADE
jgi:hypothetical protein